MFPVRILVVISCAYMLGGCATALPGAENVRSLFVGEWEVTPRGFYAENPDGTRAFPFGEDAVGRVILTKNGRAANLFQRSGRSKCAAGTSPFNCTTEEAAAAFKSAVAYQYRYRIEPDVDDPLRGNLVWNVDYVMYPNWQDQELPRRYEMNRDGMRWVLIAPLPQNPKLTVKVHLERTAPAGK